MSESNRPPDRPTCKHGIEVSSYGSCCKCNREEYTIRQAVKPMVDEFWENRGKRDLGDLLFRAYWMGIESQARPTEPDETKTGEMGSDSDGCTCKTTATTWGACDYCCRGQIIDMDSLSRPPESEKE